MRLISLGRSCETAFQIRMHTPKVDADFFDWLITPFDGLLAALKSDFSNLLRPEDLYLQEDKNFINNRQTGIQYGHVFLRDDSHLHPDNFLDDLDRVNSIFEHLKQKFIRNATSEKPLGFVRRRLSSEEGQTLREVFSKRFPDLTFKIIAVNAEPQGVAQLDPARFIELIVPESGPDGLGFPQPWASALLAAGLTRQPFVKSKDDVFHRLMVHMGGDVRTLVEEAGADASAALNAT